MPDEIIVSALKRELSAAAKDLREAIRSEGYMPRASGPFGETFMDALSDELGQDTTSREEIVQLLDKILRQRIEALQKFDERAGKLHTVAHRYDQVRERLRTAEAS